jgi:F-type H+-transporting ATPase subunit delta
MPEDLNFVDRYAEALYQVTHSDNKTTQVVKDLGVLQQLLQAIPKYFVYLSAPITSFSKQKAVIQVLTKKYKFNQLTENFLFMICANRRLKYVQQIIAYFFTLHQKSQEILEVEIKSASALTDKQKKEIEQYLEKTLKKKIMLNLVVDLEILGGLIIKIGSIVVDNSVINKVNKIRFEKEDFIE